MLLLYYCRLLIKGWNPQHSHNTYSLPIPRDTSHEDWIWKKNVPFLYDDLIIKALPWPTLTTEWLSTPVSPPTSGTQHSRLYAHWPILLCEDTPATTQSEVQMTVLQWPLLTDPLCDEIPNIEDVVRPQHSVVSRLALPPGLWAVRAAVEPCSESGESSTVVTGLTDGNLLVCDFEGGLRKYADAIASDGLYVDERDKDVVGGGNDVLGVLIGNSGETTGISWCDSPLGGGNIAASSEDGSLSVWNVVAERYTKTCNVLRNVKEQSAMEPTYQIRNSDACTTTNDVEWTRASGCELMSVGDDGKLCVWDTRANKGASDSGASRSEAKPVLSSALSKEPLLCISASCDSSTSIFATGGYGCELNVWDLRFLTLGANGGQMRHTAAPLLSLDHHRYGIYTVQFHPRQPSLCLTGGLDHRVCIWDIVCDERDVKMTKSQLQEGPPQLIMIHGGHQNTLFDARWCPHDGSDLPVSSCDGDNLLQIWTVGQSVFCDEDDETMLRKMKGELVNI